MESKKPSDEESQKRNTDCVYFLASPLTCKKGAECEFRHSDSARINPRDCWYWLNGNCLNLSCPFRHPPLEGRTAPSVSGVPSVGPIPPTKRVPCFYFFHGFCAKGEKCLFMHGTQTAPTVEAASQKLTNPVIDGVSESNEKQTSSKKETGNRPHGKKLLQESSVEVQEFVDIQRANKNQSEFSDAKPIQRTQALSDRQNGISKGRAAEATGSTGFTKTFGHQLLPAEEFMRSVSVNEEGLFHSQYNDERFRQVQCGEDRGHQISPEIQSPGDRLLEVQSVEEGVLHGAESEDLLEESSSGFDVLVDSGSGQLLYPDGADYLHYDDILMEPGISHDQGPLMHPDDLAEFDYEYAGMYDQSGYYDVSAHQFEHGPYDLYEEYNNLNPDGHMSKKRPGVHDKQSGDRCFGRERHGMISENQLQQRFDSGDLRGRITKRRRVSDMGQNVHSRQGYLGNDYQRGRRCHYDQQRQQEGLMQNHVSMQDGTRKKHKRLHGRAESVGNKRLYRDFVSDYGRGNKEMTFMKVLPRNRAIVDSVLRSKARTGDHARHAFEDAVGPRGSIGCAISNKRKQDIWKDGVDFAGPKSLAQIKAEKNISSQESIIAESMLDEHRSNPRQIPPGEALSQKQVLSLKNDISSAPHPAFDMGHKGLLLGKDRKMSTTRLVTIHDTTKGLGFEGPKPLSVILETKRKMNLEDGQKSEESRKEKISANLSFKPATQLQDSEYHATAGSSCQRAVANPQGTALEHQQDPCSEHRVQQINGFDVHHDATHLQNLMHHMGSAVLEKGVQVTHMTAFTKVQANHGVQDRVGEDTRTALDTYLDVELEPEPGDINLEEEEFAMDDDDEDDFAKKLGGIFT